MEHPQKVDTVKCAVCGLVKQEANHWFVVSLCGAEPSDPLFGCWPIGASDALEEWHRPVCGQGCAQKEFERWMTEVRKVDGLRMAASAQEN